MRRSIISVTAMVLGLCAGGTAAHADPGWVSPSLLSTGTYRCSVFNAHPTTTATVQFLCVDEACQPASAAVIVQPGWHKSFAFPAATFPTGSVSCFARLAPANAAPKGSLTVSFSAEDASGQTTAAAAMPYNRNITWCASFP